MEQQKFTLEAAEENSEVFETLTLATATSKELLSTQLSSESSFSVDLKNEMASAMEDRAKVENLFAEGATGLNDFNEEELLHELSNLSLEENANEEARI